MTTAVQLLVGDRWIDGLAGGADSLISPSTGQLIGTVERASTEQVDAAVEAAWRGHRELTVMTAFERSKLAHAVADLIETRAARIAHDLSLENGKPLTAEALPEVLAAAEMFRDAAEGVKRLESSVIPSSDPRKRVFTIRQARGVYGVLTPWNFPATIPSEYLSAGLATGNGIVWKPSELTPLTARHIAQCFLDAGAPAGSVNLVTGDPADVGSAVASHPQVTAIGMTGSSRTGKIVARAAAGKPMLLELGGNCPVIVFDDVNPADIADNLAFGAFANAGQICDSVERILVHRSIYEDLVDAMADAASRVALGSPFDESTTMGPVISESSARRIDEHLADAVSKGAEVVVGGGRGAGHPTTLYYQPTVIKGMTAGMIMERDETFGPVAAFSIFDDERDAVDQANNSPTGLVGAVFTRDIGRALRVAESLRTGVVNVNESTAYWQPHTPFGGFSGTESGIGRLGGRWTLLEMTQIKTVNVDIG